MKVPKILRSGPTGGSFDGLTGTYLRGWVSVPDGQSPAYVQVLVDGQYYARACADVFRPDLLAAGISNGGRAAFVVHFIPSLIGKPAGGLVEVVVEGSTFRLLGTMRLPSGEAKTVGLAAVPLWRNLGLQLARRRAAAASLSGGPSAGLAMGADPIVSAAGAPAAAANVSPLTPSIHAATPPRALARERMQAPYAESLAAEIAAMPADKTALRFRLVGHIDGHYSLSRINRGLALGLDTGSKAIVINHFHGARIAGLPQQIDRHEAGRINALIQEWDDASADDGERVSICHHYPLIKDDRPARLRLGMFFWEESRVPQEHVDHLNTHFDAIVVATQFVRKVLRDSGCDRPIRVIPIGVDVAAPASPVADAPRPSRPVRFLHVSSAFPRKGVDALLEAFFEEFTSGDDVELVIKTFPNIHNTTNAQIEHLRSRYADAPVVRVDEDFLDESGLRALYESCDVVVLPTRGEGFNLPAAEAMCLEKPVIATGYGGQWDFLTGRTGWCLNFDFAQSASHVSSSDSLWLEPDRGQLRWLLREFAQTDLERGVVGGRGIEETVAAGAALVRKVYTWDNAARVVEDYARRLLERPTAAAKTQRVAWISSWNCKCGIAEYSRMLTAGFDPGEFRLTFICDTRTAAGAGVLPLYNANPGENLDFALNYVESDGFDIVVLQYQPSLVDIAAALPRLVMLQKKRPVFLFMHSTRQLVSSPPAASTVEQLRRLERIFVHTLDDLAVLKNLDIVENVTLLRHGINAAVPNDTSPREKRLSIGRALAELQPRTLAPRQRDLLAARMKQGEFWLASFGFLLPHKGIAELIEAMRLLRDAKQGGMRLLLLCASLDERSRQLATDLRAAVERHGLDDVVVLIDDFLSVPEITTLLAASDLLVYPYQETLESASGALRVGLASGRPILTTPLRIFEEVSAFAFRSRDGTPRGLADAIQSLVSRPERLEEHRTVQADWTEECRWANITSRLSAMFLGTIVDRDLAAPVATPRPDFPRPAAGDPTGLDLPIPLCPPGVAYPRTGRPRPWLTALYRLTSSRSNDPHTAVAWRPENLDLVLTEGRDAGAAIHLAPSTRAHLADAILAIDTIDLDAISETARPALFQYARRHGLRTVVEAAKERSDPAVLMADLVHMERGSVPSPRATNGSAPADGVSSSASVPQVCHDRTAALECAEALTLRRLNVRGADAAGSSKLIAALRGVAGRAVDLAGEPVVAFDADETRAAGWRLLCAASLAGADEATTEPSARTALLVTPDDSGVLDVEAVLPRLLDSKLILFEDPQIYRDVFAALSRKKVPLAILRDRAVLLADEGDETDAALVDRFARLLRTTHQLRLRDVIAPRSPLDRPPLEKSAKLLSICVSTYNRADWLRVTLPLLIREAAAHRDDVQFLIVDNASTDNTERVVADICADADWVTYVRNKRNVGMLGNLAVTSRLAQGDYVWIIGDDDLVKPETVTMILIALLKQPRTELLYLNYAYTHFDKPSDLRDVPALIASATPIAPATPSGFHEEIRSFAANNENFFTAIYACVFRRDHALAAYCQYTAAPPFSDLASCIPTTKYVLEHMLDRPGYWIGSQQIVVNMNVSWMRYAPVWHLERLPEVYNLAEEMGVAASELKPYRVSNVGQAVHFTPSGFGDAGGVRNLLSMARYIEKARAVSSFEANVDALLARYEAARDVGQDVGDAPSAGTLRAVYGL